MVKIGELQPPPPLIAPMASSKGNCKHSKAKRTSLNECQFMLLVKPQTWILKERTGKSLKNNRFLKHFVKDEAVKLDFMT